MANAHSIASAALSVQRLLDVCFSEHQPVDDSTAKAVLVTTDDWDTDASTGRLPDTGITIFPYRLDLNRVMRPAWSAVGSLDGRGHLPLDMHFLITPWATLPEDELRLLGAAMQCLEATPILSGPLLEASGGWEPGDAVQVVLGDITTEEIMRTFDSLPHDYKLSVPYIARVIRIDTAAQPLTDVMKAVARVSPAIPGCST
jgi:hypothetical protein